MEPLSSDPEAFFQDAKAYLSRSAAPGAPCLLDHVGEVLLTLAEEKPSDPLAAFERLSFRVKRDAPPRRGLENGGAFAATSADGVLAGNAEDERKKDLFRTEDEALEDARSALRERKGFGPPGANEDDDEEVDALELPEPNDGEFPDVLGDQRILEWAGAGLGPEESYELTLSIKRLVEAVPIARARFWGKILGTQADYYIVESEFRDGDRPDSDDEDALNDSDSDGGARSDDDDDGEGGDGDGDGEDGLPALPRPRKSTIPALPKEKHSGANRFTYWCSSSAHGEWVRLPSVTPEQIIAARRIRRYLTGNPRAEVPSYPPFPGCEAELLRAQIARISHTTSVAPRGLYAEDEDADEDELDAAPPVKAEEYEPAALEDLADPEAWVHTERKILAQGRVKHWAPDPEDDDEDDDDEDDDEDGEGNGRFRLPKEKLPAHFDPEEAPEALAGVAEDDEIVPETVPAFSVRVCGSACARYGAVALQSNLWPGAVAVAGPDGRVASVYVGYGLKSETAPFTPAALPAPAEDPVEEQEDADPDHEEERRVYEKSLRKEAGTEDEDEDEEDYSDED